MILDCGIEIKSNIHTHSTFSDGKSTVREIADTAIAMGLDTIGFSEHSHLSFDKNGGMSPESTAAYKEESPIIKNEYKGRIDILTGIEQDFYSDTATDGYDFVLGSVHYVMKDGKYLPVDMNADVMHRNVFTEYLGSALLFARDYFATVADMCVKIKPDVVSHFDLLCKYNEIEHLFDEDDKIYLSASHDAVITAVNLGIPFEINTGAMSRKYRTTPYPGKTILRDIKNCGGKILFSSDSHSADTIIYAFDDAVKLARECGFKTALYMTKNGFSEMKI